MKKKKKGSLWSVIGLSCSAIGLGASILLAVLSSSRGESPGTALVLLGCCGVCLLVNLMSYLHSRKAE